MTKHKVGDILEDGRIVDEVDEDGNPTIIRRPKGAVPPASGPVKWSDTSKPASVPAKAKPLAAPKVEAPVITKAAPVVKVAAPKVVKATTATKDTKARTAAVAALEAMAKAKADLVKAKAAPKVVKAAPKAKPVKASKAKAAKPVKAAKPATKVQGKPKAHPDLKSAKVPMSIKGKIHGSGHRLTDAEKTEMLRLRDKDPDTFTLRRLSVIYGMDPGSVWYALNGGRAKSIEKREAKAKRAKAAKARAKAAKAVKAAPKAA